MKLKSRILSLLLSLVVTVTSIPMAMAYVQAEEDTTTNTLETKDVSNDMTWTTGSQIIADSTNLNYGKPYASTSGRQYSNNVTIPDGYTHLTLTMLVGGSTNTGGIVFFDEDGNALAGYYCRGENSGVELKTYNIPDGATYFATTIWTADSITYPYDIDNYQCYMTKDCGCYNVATSMKWTTGSQIIADSTNPRYGKPNPSTTGRQYSNNVTIPDGYTHLTLTMLVGSSTNTGGIVFFDEDGNALAGYYCRGENSGVELKTYNIPDGATYFATSIWTADSSTYAYDISNYKCYMTKGCPHISSTWESINDEQHNQICTVSGLTDCGNGTVIQQGEHTFGENNMCTDCGCYNVATCMTWTTGSQIIADSTNLNYGKPYASTSGRQYSNNVTIPDGYTHLTLTMLVGGSTNTGGIVFFNEDGNALAGYYCRGENSGVELKTYNIPDGATYFATSIWTADSSTYAYDISNYKCYMTKGCPHISTSWESVDASNHKKICSTCETQIGELEAHTYSSEEDGAICLECQYVKGSKKPYTAEWERFTVQVNQAPYIWEATVDGETVGKPDPDKEDYEPVTGVIALPEKYSADGEKTKLIMFAHGGHGYVDKTHWYPGNEDMEETVNALLDAGYAVFDCNGYKDTPYEEWQAMVNAGDVQMGIGLPQVVEGYYNCYQYILENYNIEPGLYIQGCSQGGHTSLTFAKMHPEDVTAVAWMAGHIELYDQGYIYQTLNNKRQVAQLLGFNNTTFTTEGEAKNAYEHDKADPWDPMKWIKDEEFLKGWTVPIKFFYGTNDTILPQYKYVKEFHQALNDAGFKCDLRWYEGKNHHDVAPAADVEVRQDMIAYFQGVDEEYYSTTFTDVEMAIGDSVALTYYLELTEPLTDGETLYADFVMEGVSGANATIEGEPTDDSGRVYAFTFSDIRAQEINNKITATVDVNGMSIQKTYSVLDYCNAFIEMEAGNVGYTDDAKRGADTLIIDLVTYCTEVQKYRANANQEELSEDALFIKALRSGESTGSTHSCQIANPGVTVMTEVEEKNCLWTSLTLVSKDKVSIRSKFCVENVDALKVCVTKGNNTETLTVGNGITNLGNDIYQVDYDNILPTQYSDVISFAVYVGDEQISWTLAYSVNQYIYNMKDNEMIGSLVKALYNYGMQAMTFKNLLSNGSVSE